MAARLARSSSLDTSHWKTLPAPSVLADFFERALEALALIGEEDGGAFALKRLRDGVGNTPLIGDPENERRLTLQQRRHNFLV